MNRKWSVREVGSRKTLPRACEIKLENKVFPSKGFLAEDWYRVWKFVRKREREGSTAPASIFIHVSCISREIETSKRSPFAGYDLYRAFMEYGGFWSFLYKLQGEKKNEGKAFFDSFFDTFGL